MTERNILLSQIYNTEKHSSGFSLWLGHSFHKANKLCSKYVFNPLQEVLFFPLEWLKILGCLRYYYCYLLSDVWNRFFCFLIIIYYWIMMMIALYTCFFCRNLQYAGGQTVSYFIFCKDSDVIICIPRRVSKQTRHWI